SSARRLIDESHLAHHAARADALDDAVLERDGDAPLENDVHERSGFTLRHENFAPGRMHRGTSLEFLLQILEHLLVEDAALAAGHPRAALAHQLYQNAHQHERELGYPLDGFLELLLVERYGAALRLRRRRRGARQMCERSHLAEDLASRYAGYDLVFRGQADL